MVDTSLLQTAWDTGTKQRRKCLGLEMEVKKGTKPINMVSRKEVICGLFSNGILTVCASNTVINYNGACKSTSNIQSQIVCK